MTTDRQLAGHQRRTLRSMREKLVKMASDWDGRDQFNMSELERLADELKSVAASMVVDEDEAA